MFDLPLAEIRRLYNEGKSSIEIAEIFCVSRGAIERRLGKMRSHSEAMKLAYRLGKKQSPSLELRGNKSPNWKGGIKKNGGYIYVKMPNHPRAPGSAFWLPRRKGVRHSDGLVYWHTKCL